MQPGCSTRAEKCTMFLRCRPLAFITTAQLSDSMAVTSPHQNRAGGGGDPADPGGGGDAMGALAVREKLKVLFEAVHSGDDMSFTDAAHEACGSLAGAAAVKERAPPRGSVRPPGAGPADGGGGIPSEPAG